MTLTTIPDAELIVGTYLRAHADVVALNTRIVGETPSSVSGSWVQVLELDAPSDPRSTADHLVASYFQISVYASKAGTDGSQQKELAQMRGAIRAALIAMPSASHTGAVVTRVRINGDSRIPDPTLEPARQRRIITATVYHHRA